MTQGPKAATTLLRTHFGVRIVDSCLQIHEVPPRSNTLDYAKQVTAEHRGRVTPWIAKFRGVHIFSNVLARVHILNRIVLDVGIVGTPLLAPGMDTHG